MSAEGKPGIKPAETSDDAIQTGGKEQAGASSEVLKPREAEAPALGLPVKPGWHAAHPEILPRPTYWPVIMAMGIVFLAFGIITSWLICIVGAVLFGVALAGWIGDLVNEQREHEH